MESIMQSLPKVQQSSSVMIALRKRWVSIVAQPQPSICAPQLFVLNPRSVRAKGRRVGPGLFQDIWLAPVPESAQHGLLHCVFFACLFSSSHPCSNQPVGVFVKQICMALYWLNSILWLLVGKHFRNLHWKKQIGTGVQKLKFCTRWIRMQNSSIFVGSVCRTPVFFFGICNL